MMPGEAVSGRDRALQTADHAADLRHPRQTGQRAGEHHHEHGVPCDIDTGVAGGFGIVAGQPDLVAPFAAVEDEPDDNGGDRAEEQPQMQRQSAKSADFLGIIGQSGQPGGSGKAGTHLETAFAPHAEDEKIVPLDGDIVHHQGGDDLVDVELGFEIACHKAPQRAADETGDHHHRDENPAGCFRGQYRCQHDGAGGKCADKELALGANVPQFHTEGDRTGQPDQDQRRRLDEDVRDAAPDCRITPRRCWQRL